MRRTLFLLLSITVVQLYAQRFSFIPKVGYNAAHISGLSEDAKTRHGINAGLSLEYRFSQYFAMETGGYYSMQGTTMTYELGEELIALELEVENDYITIPLLVKGYFYKGIYLYAGPQIGFRINSNLNVHGKVSFLDLLELENSDNYDISGYLNNVDFSGVLGLGYQFDIGLMISANYNWGMNKLFNTKKVTFEGLDLLNLSNTRNKVFQINIGWSF